MRHIYGHIVTVGNVRLKRGDISQSGRWPGENRRETNRLNETYPPVSFVRST